MVLHYVIVPVSVLARWFLKRKILLIFDHTCCPPMNLFNCIYYTSIFHIREKYNMPGPTACKVIHPGPTSSKAEAVFPAGTCTDIHIYMAGHTDHRHSENSDKYSTNSLMVLLSLAENGGPLVRILIYIRTRWISPEGLPLNCKILCSIL